MNNKNVHIAKDTVCIRLTCQIVDLYVARYGHVTAPLHSINVLTNILK